LALTIGAGLVAAGPAATPASAEIGCTITSQVQSGLNWNVSAANYCSNGYVFRAIQRYVNNNGNIIPTYGAWKSVATSTATRPSGTLFNSGTYEIA
jgi:hypothetical protein